MLSSVEKRRLSDWKSKLLFMIFMLFLLTLLFRCIWFCLSTRASIEHGLSPQNPVYFEKSGTPSQRFLEKNETGRIVREAANFHYRNKTGGTFRSPGKQID
ncbi:MAG: hypothetical protein ACYCXP_06785 [Leptospirillum sp.]